MPLNLKTTEGTAVSFDTRDTVEGAKKAELKQAPLHGSVEIEGRMVAYLPKAGTLGKDKFVLRVRKGSGNSSSLTVNVEIERKPQGPPKSLAVRARELTADMEAAPRVTATTTTLQQALLQLKPGEVLYLDRGAYAGIYELPFVDTVVLVGPGAVLAAEFVLPSA
jgi:hypothetical protein